MGVEAEELIIQLPGNGQPQLGKGASRYAG
jgi:hypothetical protein